MDRYTHVAMYRLSTYIGVHMVRVKCEKYSLKSEILGENSKFLISYHITFRSAIFLTIWTEILQVLGSEHMSSFILFRLKMKT